MLRKILHLLKLLGMSYPFTQKKYLVLLFAILWNINFSSAQSFQWATQTGNTYSETIESMRLDQYENVYIIGTFVGTVDFDPGPSVVNLSTNSVFTRESYITKTDSNGHLIWAKKFTNTSGSAGMSSCQINSNQEIYLGGGLNGTVDFDPGPGVNSVTATNAMYVAKLNQNGDLLWVKTMSSTNNAKITEVNIDTLGNLYCGGNFAGSLDFDPYAGTYSLSSSSIYPDLFIAKYDSSLQLIWAKLIRGNDNKTISDLVVNANGVVTLCGTFEGVVDVDPSATVVNMTVTGTLSSDQDVFILQLDQNGNLNWAKQIGNTQNNDISSLQINSAGDILVAGDFNGTIDFDPGIGVTSLTASSLGVYILKLDHLGNFVWVKQIGGNSFTYCNSISLDAFENIYATGSTFYTVDFDPGPNNADLTAISGEDIYLLKLDMNGNFIWVKQMGGINQEVGNRIHVASSNNIYTSGIFKDTVDFNPSVGVNLMDAAGPSGFSGNYDAYLLKLRQCIETNSTLSVTACDQYMLNGTTYTNSGNYQQVFVNNGGCDSIVALQLTIQSSSTNNVSVSACDQFTFNGSTYTNSGSYNHTFTGSNGCDSLIILQLSLFQTDSILMSLSSCNSYSYNSQTYTNSGLYTHSFINSNGCDSIVLLNLTILQSDNDTLNQTACDSYLYNGQTYTSSGTYTHTFTNTSSCDSIVLLQLQMSFSDSNAVTQTACDSYTYLSQTYTSSGVYSHTLINSTGCDSIVLLNLTINTLNATIMQVGNSLTAYPSAATYQWIRCPSNTILIGGTNQNVNILIDGLYAVIVTQNGCVDTSQCVEVKGVGIDEILNDNTLSIYPNPTKDFSTIEFASNLSGASIRLIAMDGSILHTTKNFSGKSFRLNLSSLSSGVYVLEVQISNQPYRTKIVKE